MRDRGLEGKKMEKRVLELYQSITPAYKIPEDIKLTPHGFVRKDGLVDMMFVGPHNVWHLAEIKYAKDKNFSFHTWSKTKKHQYDFILKHPNTLLIFIKKISAEDKLEIYHFGPYHLSTGERTTIGFNPVLVTEPRKFKRDYIKLLKTSVGTPASTHKKGLSQLVQEALSLQY